LTRQLCNGLDPETRIEARPDRKAENGNGVIGDGASSSLATS